MDCITVIVAVYNVEKYIEKCLYSICHQTYKNLEIIVIDDGSTDSSGAICDKIAGEDTRVRVIHKQNAGVSAARNTGLELATGRFVAFVDGDDYLEEEMYERMLTQLQKDKAQMAICSFRYVYTGKIKYERQYFRQGSIMGEVFLKSLLQDAFGFYYSVVWNKLISREVIEKNGLRFDEKWNIMEDFRFVLQLIPCIEKMEICTQALYNYRKDNYGTATNREITFEESFRNRKQGYLWLRECLVACNCFEQNKNMLADYLIRYLASQYAKAVFARNREEKLCEHREIKRREFITAEWNNCSLIFRYKRKLFWNVKYLSWGMVQRLREIIRKR